MNYNSEQYGFEIVQGKRRGPRSSAQTPAKPSERRKGSSKNTPGSAGSKSDKAIEFSKKVIESLKNKVKEHNSKNKKKVTLGQLKKVFRRGAGAFSSSHRPGLSRAAWAMARVNTFLRMVSGEKVKDSYRKADSDIARASNSDYTIEANFEPSEEDLMQADEEINNFDLNKFEFNSEEELYLDDEEDSPTFRFEI